MLKLHLILFTAMLLTNKMLAQPNINFIKTFDGGVNEYFSDVYSISTGGYIMVGTSNEGEGYGLGNLYLVRVDEDGNEIWSTTYEASEDGYGTSVIEADNGDFVVGCRSSSEFHAMRVRDDGELVWRRSYDRLRCNAVIELKNGNFMLAGDAGWCGRIVYIDGQGNVIWNRTYQQARLSKFNSLRETDGGVVASGYGAPQIRNASYAWAIKVQIENGDPIWSHLFNENGISYYYGMTSAGDGGFAICGHWTDHSATALVKFDSRGEEVWEVHGADWGYQGRATGIHRAHDGGYAIAAYIHSNDPDGGRRPSAARFSANGELLWSRIYALDEDERFAVGLNMFGSVIVNRDNELLVVGGVNTVHDDDDINYDGLLMKLERDTIGPRLIRRSPETIQISTLINDVVHFKAVAYSPYRGELDYLWTLNDSTDGIEVRNDTLATVVFDRLVVDTVCCDISDADARISVIWHVTVTDLYISAFTPDTLSLAIRRGESVDFSLDTVRAVEGDAIDYLWLRRNVDVLGEVDTAGSESGATIEFLQSGHYRVDGMASRGESSDVVSWDVSVRGAIWAFAPEDLAFEVLPDSMVNFVVEPTIPDAEGQTIWWLIDGEVAAEDTTLFNWSFGEANSCPPHLVQVVVADTFESDTVTWVVTVVDPDFVDGDDFRQAGTPVLLTVSPNPFNSTLTIAFPTGSAAHPTRLAIFDISGRLVADFSQAAPPYSPPLIEGRVRAATYGEVAVERNVIWDATSVPAGVYFARLQTGAILATKKVVLMR